MLTHSKKAVYKVKTLQTAFFLEIGNQLLTMIISGDIISTMQLIITIICECRSNMNRIHEIQRLEESKRDEIG